MLIEIVDRVQGYKCFEASTTTVNLICRNFRFEPGTDIAIGKEGVEFSNKYMTMRVVFKNSYTLPYVARCAVRSEHGKRALESVLQAFPAIGARD